MTRAELERNVHLCTRDFKEFNIIMTAVDAYSSASNDGKPLVIRSLPSYEDMQPLVERIAYEQLAAEQIDDLVAKMNLLRQFIEGLLLDGNDV